MTSNNTSRALFYLDQNVLGHIRDGRFRLSEHDKIIWVFSTEHLNEIARGKDTSFLSVFEHLGAREVQLSDPLEITDQATLLEYSCPHLRYKRHLEAQGEVPFDDIFTDVILRIFGAQNVDDMQSLPSRFMWQIKNLIGASATPCPSLDGLFELLSSMANKLSKICTLEETRRPLGIDRGRIGNVHSENPIFDIWAQISRSLPNVSIDQFFGFETTSKENAARPTFMGIIACHIALNIVGYKTDKGISKRQGLQRALSDGRHLAYGAFCDCLISEDRRLFEKAKAIYRYRGIGTHVIRLVMKDTRPNLHF